MHLNQCSFDCVPGCPSTHRKQQVRLISIDGSVSSLAAIDDSTSYAIIFSNQVFLFFSTIAGVHHFREVKTERVHHIETCTPNVNQEIHQEIQTRKG